MGSRLFKLISFCAIYSCQDARACVCSNYFFTIDSLAQLKEYTFIAQVRVIDDHVYKKEENGGESGDIGLVTFEIIELFKGEKTSQILEYAKNTSCDIGIMKDEEWILFGKQINGSLSVTACDRNQKYREQDGERDWKYGRGLYDLERLQKLFGHPVKKFGNEKRKEFYKSGNVEIEESYLNGKLNGERKIWYPNGKLFCRQYYISDTLDGRSEWFYASGQIYDEDYYKKGQHYNISRLYFDSAEYRDWQKLYIGSYSVEDSIWLAYAGVHVQYENIFDHEGKTILSKTYSMFGKIKSETILDPNRNFRTIIYYHDNGRISSIGYELDGKNYGHYQEYNEEGFSSRGWNYDEKGKVIKQE